MLIILLEKLDDAGLEDKVEKLNNVPLHLGAFSLSNSKRSMKLFIHSINGFYSNDVFFTNTDSLYSEKKNIANKWKKHDWLGRI